MMRPWKHHGSGRYFGRFVSLGFFPAILFLALLHVWGSWRLKFQPDNFQFSHTHHQNLDKKYIYAPFCENKNHQRPQSGLTAKVAILVGHPKSKFGPFCLFIYLFVWWLLHLLRSVTPSSESGGSTPCHPPFCGMPMLRLSSQCVDNLLACLFAYNVYDFMS